VCSHCLFPGPLDENGYCELMRAHVRQLPMLHRLVETMVTLAARGPLPSTLRVRRWPRSEWAAPDAPPATTLGLLAVAWQQLETWIVEGDGADERWLFCVRDGQLRHAHVKAATAELGELLAAGASPDDLERFDLDVRERARLALCSLLL
jgi:hypothetical protein